MCGLLIDKEESLVGNAKISEAYVEQIREDRLSRMLANEVNMHLYSSFKVRSGGYSTTIKRHKCLCKYQATCGTFCSMKPGMRFRLCIEAFDCK